MSQQERTYYQNERARITFKRAILDGAEGTVQALSSPDKNVVAPIVDAIGAMLIVHGR